LVTTSGSQSQRSRARPAGPQRGPYRPDLTRQAIIDSALELFEANGFHATSVQAVADAADVTKGAFYHHFESKEELVHIIHGQLLDYQLREMDSIAARVSSPAEQLRALIAMWVNATVRFRSHVAIYHQESRYLKETVGEKDVEIAERMERIVQAGIDDGTFRADTNAKIATLGITGMTAWVHRWLRDSGPLTPEQVADLLADMVLAGLVIA
jgi:AcrR family transcriptional regulator